MSLLSSHTNIHQHICLEPFWSVHNLLMIQTRYLWRTCVYIYIYIYAFSRRFYPKRLTLHSSCSFTFDQLLLSLGIEPMMLVLLAPCSTIWATGKHVLATFWIKNVLMMDLFCTIMQLVLTSQDFKWWTGVVWITYGLLWCFISWMDSHSDGTHSLQT